jgi:hypothetical protein
LRNSKNNAVVGYVTLADIFVGSSWMAQELFSKTGPVTPQANLEEQGDEDSEAAVCGAEDGNALNVDTVGLIARALPSHHAAKNELFVAPIPVDSEKASAEEHASHASDITTFASSPQQHKVIDTVLAPPTSPLLGDEQPARPQDASDTGKDFASGEPGLDYASHAMGETAPALQPDADASATMLAPSDDGTFEGARPDEPSGGDGMPPAVEAFMRHLTEYLHSSNHQTATLSSGDAAEVKLSLSAETQKDMDRVPFPAEPDPEGESSGSAQPSGLTGVDCEQTGDCSSVRMDSPVEMARDNHQEGHSGAAGGESRDIFSTDMDRILRAVWRDVQKNSSSP